MGELRTALIDAAVHVGSKKAGYNIIEAIDTVTKLRTFAKAENKYFDVQKLNTSLSHLIDALDDFSMAMIPIEGADVDDVKHSDIALKESLNELKASLL